MDYTKKNNHNKQNFIFYFLISGLGTQTKQNGKNNKNIPKPIWSNLYGNAGGARIGQEECLRLLEKKDNWMTSKEISEKLSQQPSNVNRALRKLFINGDILKDEGRSKYMGIKWRAKSIK